MLSVEKATKITGTIQVPGDKSISHRAVMLGAISRGKTCVEGFLDARDCLSTIDCFQALGVEIARRGQDVEIRGQGLAGLKEPPDSLNAGNSGTTLRLLAGILAGQNFLSILTGDASLRQRPMARVSAPLIQMGARIDGRQNGRLAPLVIRGGGLRGITWDSPIASAQVKSAILLAGLFAEGETTVKEPALSRDHTERMLAGFGIRVRQDGATTTVWPGEPEGQRVLVPGDISSAAFFIVAAAAKPGSHLLIKSVGLNPTRTGSLDVLRKMGADIEIVTLREVNGETVGDILVRGAGLCGTEIDGAVIPRLVDEIPVLAVAAALAEGTTYIRGAGELKVKESDRLATITSELRKLGVKIFELPDGLAIHGPNKLRGAAVETFGDHRIAMALAVCGLFADGKTVLPDSDCIAVSFPGFDRLLGQVVQ